MSWRLPIELDAGGGFPSLAEAPPPGAPGRESPGGDVPTAAIAREAELVLGVAPGERPLAGFGWPVHRAREIEGPVRREWAAALAEEALRRWAPHLGCERVEVIAVRGRRLHLEIRSRGAVESLEVELVPWDGK